MARSLCPALCTVALLDLWAVACEFPVSSSEFHVVEDDGAGPEVERLVEALAEADSTCARRVDSDCRQALAECAGTEGCVVFTECIRDNRNPGAEAECAEEHDASLATLDSFVALRSCWASLVSECPIGTDWACADEYTAPRPREQELTLVQSLSFVNGAEPLGKASVTICGLGETCLAQATTTTDESGRYSVDVPIRQDPVSLVGWLGFRLVQKDADIYPTRLQLNIPVWGDRVEETRVLQRNTADFILDNLAVDGLAAIFAQVFDCQSTGAGGIRLELQDLDGTELQDARVHYLKEGDPGNRSLTETSVRAEGAAVIYGFQPDRSYRVEARRADDGQIVSEGSLFVPQDQLVFFSLHPLPVSD